MWAWPGSRDYPDLVWPVGTILFDSRTPLLLSLCVVLNDCCSAAGTGVVRSVRSRWRRSSSCSRGVRTTLSGRSSPVGDRYPTTRFPFLDRDRPVALVAYSYYRWYSCHPPPRQRLLKSCVCCSCCFVCHFVYFTWDLFSSTNVPSFTWRIRIRWSALVGSLLQFLSLSQWQTAPWPFGPHYWVCGGCCYAPGYYSVWVK